MKRVTLRNLALGAVAASAIAGGSGCPAHRMKEPMPPAPLRSPKAEKHMAVRFSEFEKALDGLRAELAGVESRISSLRAARAAIGLKAVIGKLQRLERGFGISLPDGVAAAGKALSGLESGKGPAEAEKAVETLSAGAEELRAKHAKELDARLAVLLDELTALQKKPRILRRIYAPKVRKAARQVSALLQKIDALAEEKSLRMDVADGAEARVLDGIIASAQKSATGIRGQLSELHAKEVEKARNAAADCLRRIERYSSSPSPEAGAGRIEAMAEMRVWLDRLERLQLRLPEQGK